MTVVVFFLLSSALFAQGGDVFRDTARTIAARVDDLLWRLTLEEKISLLQHEAPAIDRLGIPAYGWWNEALHGVARAGTATVFPQAIGLAAMFDPAQQFSVATAIGIEARAKHREALRRGQRGTYQGLTFFSPNINIVRDPRWGRGQETYGEDPWLAGELGAAFVRGLQGGQGERLQAAATPKHFAVHSGPEPERHRFDAAVSDDDLYNTYLPAFERCLREAKAASVMCAYNRLRGDPCCASPLLLDSVLRGRWGFEGPVVSDCWAVSDFVGFHRVDTSTAAAAARALNAGCDITCGPEFGALRQAAAMGWVVESTIDRAARRVLAIRFRLGMFDPPGADPWSTLPDSVIASVVHDSIALAAAEKSIVLLRNARGALPLRGGLRRIAVIGPNAADTGVLLGNYNGTPPHAVTVLEGIRRRAGAGTEVVHARGCELADGLPPRGLAPGDTSREAVARAAAAALEEAVAAARRADAVVAVLGLHPSLEGEELQLRIDGFSGGDRTVIELPAPQERLLRALHETGAPVIVVLMSGSAVASAWADEHAAAVLEAWYPGQRGGDAVARVLFGDVNPAGRLPVTFYASTSQLPAFDDYAMRGRSYRFFEGKPLYAFGHGLSYTDFRYSNLRVSEDSLPAGRGLTALVTVENRGDRDGEEAVQLYLRRADAPAGAARMDLRGVVRVRIPRGWRRTVAFPLDPEDFTWYDPALRRPARARRVEILVGASSADIRERAMVLVEQ